MRLLSGPNKTKAEELIDEVEMEAAVDDEINTLLFEFVEVYGQGDQEVWKMVCHILLSNANNVICLLVSFSGLKVKVGDHRSAWRRLVCNKTSV